MRKSRWILKRGKLKAHILEEDVVEEITKRLWLQYRIKVWRIRERIPREGAAPSTAGIPDLVGWLPKSMRCSMHEEITHDSLPIPLFIECKRPQGGVRTIAQIQFIDEARRDGCVAFFAESWDDVVREMEQRGIKLAA